MKTILISFLLSFFGVISYAQNWELVNANRTVFFQHSDSTHITNTIVIDSSEINGSNTTFFTGYAFKYCDTCTGFTYQFPIIYRYAKELLGYNIQNDVTNNQYSLDSKVIKQHAQTNDSWTFYGGNIATVVSKSETTILGVLDSIKTVELSNSDTIIFSKNFGIIRYPDFENPGKYYTMLGYHEGQNSYGEYLPNFWRTYDFNVGDVFSFNNNSWYIDNNYINKIRMTILENLSQNDTIKYVVQKLSENSSHLGMANPENAVHSYWTTNYTDTILIVHQQKVMENFYGKTEVVATPLVDPINYSPLNFYGNLFYPNLPLYQNSYVIVNEININTTFSSTAKNVKQYEIYTDSLLQYSGNYSMENQFINNLGKVYQDYWIFEDIDKDYLIGAIINGDTLGIIYDYPDDLGFEEQTIKNELSFYPNPTTNQITLKGNFKSITIYNSIGQVVFESFKPNQIIDVSQLTKGLYVIKGIDKNDLIYTSKLIIE